MSGADYEALLRAHHARYPLMQAQDCVKLLYQSEFGPMHLGENTEMLMNSIAEEWKAVPETALPLEPERIGGDLCRFPLRPSAFGPEAVRLLAGLMQQTMLHCQGNPERLRERMEQLRVTEPELHQWLSETAWDYTSPVRHSARFRAAYQPHYRLLRREYAGYFSILLRIAQEMQKKRPLLIAIDGCCGSGKTQLAALLQALFPCRVFHTDHYYLPIAKRETDWQQRPAGNMDLERLWTEVIQPVQADETVYQRVFDCAAQQLGDPQAVVPAPLSIVEGSYSLHPMLADAYDMRIFLTCSEQEQKTRLQAREGAYFEMFERVWIPMEKRYYAECAPLSYHPMVVDTSSFFCESFDSLCI